MPATLKLDGKPLSKDAVASLSPELEFTVDAQDKWITHKVTAEPELQDSRGARLVAGQ